MEKSVNVIGAGLAGSEAVWQLVNRGVKVDLYEMRPVKQTPAHHTDKFAELVCTNSLRANGLTNAVGVIKEEMRMLILLSLKLLTKHLYQQEERLRLTAMNFLVTLQTK